MLNELKVTLSIILVSCMISPLYGYVEAASAVAHSGSNAGLCYYNYCYRDRGTFDSVRVCQEKSDSETYGG